MNPVITMKLFLVGLILTITNFECISSFILPVFVPVQHSNSYPTPSSSSSSSSSFSSSSLATQILAPINTSTSLFIFQTETRSNTCTATEPTNTDADNNGSNDSTKTVIPFIIEELNQLKANLACEEISDLVIKVFFEEEAELQSSQKPSMTPFKAMQLAYLKNLQKGDIKGKKFLLSRNINNSMFVAREVIPLYNNYKNDIKSISSSSLSEIIDIKNNNKNNDVKIYNKECIKGSTLLKKGQILGFVDVSEKTFGLTLDNAKSVIDKSSNKNNDDNNNNKESSPMKKRTLRPVLTNLSVKEEARRSGVGSALVDACENIVQTSWSTIYNEMVLEVEQENLLAQKFYEKRGYVALYADPTSRRYETNGIILSEVRTTKISYRKELKKSITWGDSVNNIGTGSFFDFPFFAKVRNAISAK